MTGWSPEMMERLRELSETNLSTSTIADILGTTKNAVCGKRRRLKLPLREQPVSTGRRGTGWDTPKRVAKAIKLRREGFTLEEILARLGTKKANGSAAYPGPPLPSITGLSKYLSRQGVRSPVKCFAWVPKAPIPPRPLPAIEASAAPPEASRVYPGKGCRWIHDEGPWLRREPLWCGKPVAKGVYCSEHWQQSHTGKRDYDV